MNKILNAPRIFKIEQIVSNKYLTKLNFKTKITF